MIAFEFEADRQFFTQLLCAEGESLDDYAELFDFDPPAAKRAEFARIRNDILQRRLAELGETCQLRLNERCDTSSGLTIDHVIPLSSNNLNKALRAMGTSRTPEGRLIKTPTQSFGSNHPRNLILACASCNGHKKNRILDRDTLRRILAT